MTTIVTESTINKPATQVFDYVTTPANWLTWHPSSLALRGATDHPLQVGEEVTEDFRVAGRKGTVVWTVVERDAPRRWVISGAAGDGGGGTITYTLTDIPGGTAFRRELAYRMPNALLALLDWLLIRRRISTESAQAVRQLKQALEKS